MNPVMVGTQPVWDSHFELRFISGRGFGLVATRVIRCKEILEYRGFETRDIRCLNRGYAAGKREPTCYVDADPEINPLRDTGPENKDSKEVLRPPIGGQGLFINAYVNEPGPGQLPNMSMTNAVNRIWLVVTRDIALGEELLWFYGDRFSRSYSVFSLTFFLFCFGLLFHLYKPVGHCLKICFVCQ